MFCSAESCVLVFEKLHRLKNAASDVTKGGPDSQCAVKI